MHERAPCDAIRGHARRFHQLRLEVIEIDARQRLRQMQIARMAVQAHAVPIEHAVGGIGILLDLKDHQAVADGMDPPARQEHRVAGAHRDAVKAIGHVAVVDLLLELRAGHALLQPHIQAGVGRGVGDIPHLRLRLALQFRRLVRGGMDLEGKFFARVEDFAEQRKPARRRRTRGAEHLGGMIFHQPAQVLARQGTVRDHARIARPVGDFPGLADGRAGRQRLAIKPFQFPASPDTVLENGLENQGVKHDGYGLKSSVLKVRSD